MKKPLTAILGMLIVLLIAWMWLLSLETSAYADGNPTPVPTIPPFRTPTPQPVCPPDCDYLSKGNGYFIVKLKVPYQKEASLSKEQIKAQRATIAAAQQTVQWAIDDLRTERDFRRFVETRYEASPYVQFLGDQVVINALVKNPLVERIYIDELLGEAYGMGLEDVQIDLDAIFGKALPTFKPAEQHCYLFTCDQIIERAKKKGAVYLNIVLKLQKEWQPVGALNAQHYAQNVVMRQTIYRFAKSAVGQSIMVGSPDSTTHIISGYANADGVKFLLESPLVSYIVDHTDEGTIGAETDP